MKEFDAYGLLCSWGLHSYRKQITFVSPESSFKLAVNVCPKCGCPKKKTFKMLFGKGNYRISKDLFQELTLFLENTISGETYGENAWCYRTRTAKDLLFALQVKKVNLKKV